MSDFDRRTFLRSFFFAGSSLFLPEILGCKTTAVITDSDSPVIRPITTIHLPLRAKSQNETKVLTQSFSGRTYQPGELLQISQGYRVSNDKTEAFKRATPVLSSFDTPVFFHETTRQPMQISSYKTWIFGNGSILFLIDNFWIDLMLINERCGFVVMDNTKYETCSDGCGVSLMTQIFQYNYGVSGAKKLKMSIPVGKNSSTALEEHKKHTEKFKGCDLNVVQPTHKDCLSAKPID